MYPVSVKPLQILLRLSQISMTSKKFPALSISLPEWVDNIIPQADNSFPTHQHQMNFVIQLAEENIKNNTGGPFAAAIFDIKTNALIAPGVNLVVSTNWSGAHAEQIAIALAQQVIGQYSLRGYQLVTSAEPCVMCHGAIHWSKIGKLLIGARSEDVENIGFDEGDKHTKWLTKLRNTGVDVIRDVERKKAIEVLNFYKSSGGIIYNG